MLLWCSAIKDFYLGLGVVSLDALKGVRLSCSPAKGADTRLCSTSWATPKTPATTARGVDAR